MNTGQMLITIGAMVLLGLVVLRVSSGFLTTNTVMLETKFDVLAVSLATSVIEEATGKAFDQNTDTSAVNLLSSLSTIGKDGETYPDFNDFDDYYGFTKIDSTLPSAIFRIDCQVGYIDPANPEVLKTTPKTWHKKLNVQVTSPSMTDTIKLSTIYSYFHFR